MLTTLTSFVAPPEDPSCAGTASEWEGIKSKFPFGLPSDYRDYISTYGYGELADTFIVYSPFSSGSFNLIEVHDEIDSYVFNDGTLDSVMDEARKDGKPGLIMFGRDVGGAHLHWLTVGEPDDWPLVLGGGRGLFSTHTLEWTMTEFFVRCFKGTALDWRYGAETLSNGFFPLGRKRP